MLEGKKTLSERLTVSILVYILADIFLHPQSAIQKFFMISGCGGDRIIYRIVILVFFKSHLKKSLFNLLIPSVLCVLVFWL